MSIHRKAFLCILLTGLFSAAFVVFSYSRLFDLIEFEYYAPSISRDMQTKINADARAISAKFGKLEGMFERMLENTSIRSAFAPNQNQIVIFDSSRIAGELTTAIPELQWIRIVDAAGRRIHFSTDSADYVMRSGTAAAYRAWTETPNNFQISADMLEKNGIMLDDINERVIFYMQFYDNENIKRGVALFSLSSRIIYDALLSAELVRLSDPISLVSEPDGILIGLRADYDGSLREAVGGIWKSREFGISGTSSYAALRNIVRSSTRRSFVLFSKRTEQNIFVGFLVSEDNFTLPDALKIILVTMFTITIFVVLFFLFNIKQDTATIIQNRVRNLQVSLYREYSEHKLLMDWGEWKRELASRREDVRMELRRGFGAKKLKYADAYINSFFDRCWDELVNVISSQTKNQLESLDEKKLEDILKRILAASTAISDSLKGNTPNGNTLKGNNPDTVKKSEKTVEFQPDSEGEIMQELDESGIKNEKAKPDELEEFLESEALESELCEAEEIYAIEAETRN
jgi:translation initiation factor 1 (eIF-1/SUI1)